jgi:hypothetical protein
MLTEDEIGYADMFFALWSNTEPAQYSFEIKQFDSSHAFGEQNGFEEKQYRYQVKAIQTLDMELKSRQPHPFFIGTGKKREPQTSHALCYTGDCVFFRNPTLMKVESYDINKDFARGTRKNLPTMKEAVVAKQNQEEFAVDRDVLSGWTAPSDLAEGDYYGIRTFGSSIKDQLHIIFQHSVEAQLALNLEISLDGTNWIELTHSVSIYETRINWRTYRLATYVFDLGLLQGETVHLRLLNVAPDRQEAFIVCHIGLLTLIFTKK